MRAPPVFQRQARRCSELNQCDVAGVIAEEVLGFDVLVDDLAAVNGLDGFGHRDGSAQERG